jgi:hypothetical protein
MNKVPDTAMTAEEMDLVARVARLYGITTEQAHTNLAKAGLARRVRKRTGRGPARISEIKRGAVKGYSEP